MAKEITEREKKKEKCTAWSQYAFLPKKRERESKGSKKKKPWTLTYRMNPAHDPRNWNIFHIHTLFDYHKKRRFFHSLLLTQKDIRFEDFFPISKNVTGSFCLVLTFHN